MKLYEALNLNENEAAALIGGGGKTSTLLALGREAGERGLKAVLTTTTRIYKPDDPEIPLVVSADRAELMAATQRMLQASGLVVAGTGLAPDQKIVGVDPDWIGGFLLHGAGLVVVEADGAAHKPLKAPAAHEPVVPVEATVVVPVIGIDCLHRPLQAETVHRPERVARLAGISMGSPITPGVVAAVATHPEGYLKGLPADCRWVPFINKVETAETLAQAREIARLIGRRRPCRVIIGAVRRFDPVIEILDF